MRSVTDAEVNFSAFFSYFIQWTFFLPNGMLMIPLTISIEDEASSVCCFFLSILLRTK